MLQGVSPEGEHGRKYFHVGKPLSETKCSAYGYHLLQVCGYAYVYAYVYVYVYVYVCVCVCVCVCMATTCCGPRTLTHRIAASPPPSPSPCGRPCVRSPPWAAGRPCTRTAATASSLRARPWYSVSGRVAPSGCPRHSRPLSWRWRECWSLPSPRWPTPCMRWRQAMRATRRAPRSSHQAARAHCSRRCRHIPRVYHAHIHTGLRLLHAPTNHHTSQRLQSDIAEPRRPV